MRKHTAQANTTPSLTVNDMPEYYPKEFFSDTQINEEFNFCFVIMPFSPSFDAIYRETIRCATQTFGMSCKRGDDFYQSGRIMNTILENIQRAEIIIADLTGRNVNVFYELGIAHCTKRNVILLAQDVRDVPFDLQDFHMLPYKDTREGRKKLKIDIINAVQQLRAEQQDKTYKNIIHIEKIEDAKQLDHTHWVVKTKPDSAVYKGIQKVIHGILAEKPGNTFNELEIQCDVYTDKWYLQEIVSVHDDGSWQVCPEFGGANHRVRLTLKRESVVIDKVEIFVKVIKER